MRKLRNLLLTLSLLALVLTGPVAVAAYLLTGEASVSPLVLAAVEDDAAAPVTQPAAPLERPASVPVLAGMLYTRGAPQVDWNGVRIPVQDGGYAYLGGERISTADGDMGTLELDGGSRVYVCPGSRMSVTRAGDGAYRIRLDEGTGRFVFDAGVDYRIEANRGVYTPAADSASQPTVVEISVFEDHPGGVMCGFSSSMDVAGYPQEGDGGPIALGTAGPGEIIDLSRALRDEASGTGTPVILKPIQMPVSVKSWLRQNAPYPPEPGPIGYLCRCQELKRYAEADGIPEAAIVPLMSPPDGPPVALQESQSTPILADPGVPNPADTGVIPEPASVGEVFTVPPPLVPAPGFGGGVTSTAS